MTSSPATLITFAVKEEARPFQKLLAGNPQLQVLITGIGGRNAERAVRAALGAGRPELLLSCGFAGGLAPGLPRGTVVFAADADFRLTPALLSCGARPVQFYCARKVIPTVQEKRALRNSTGADAVEMESEIIRGVCRQEQLPSATIRVISDAADDNLPLDFNQLLTPDQNISYVRLGWAVLSSPRCVPGLLKLRRQTRAAAERLAAVLAKIIS